LDEISQRICFAQDGLAASRPAQRTRIGFKEASFFETGVKELSSISEHERTANKFQISAKYLSVNALPRILTACVRREPAL
jgi:hypothetical protein